MAKHFLFLYLEVNIFITDLRIFFEILGLFLGFLLQVYYFLPENNPNLVQCKAFNTNSGLDGAISAGGTDGHISNVAVTGWFSPGQGKGSVKSLHLFQPHHSGMLSSFPKNTDLYNMSCCQATNCLVAPWKVLKV